MQTLPRITNMHRPHRRLSELSSKELSQRAIEYRQMALTAHGEATIKSLNILAARYAVMAAKREVESSTSVAPKSEQSEVHMLMKMAEQAAASVADPVGALANAIRSIAASEADPYLTMGVLVEGAVHILRTSLPPERQDEAGSALQRLLMKRLRTTNRGM